MNQVRISSLKFNNCQGLEHIHGAFSSVFINVVSSHENDLEALKLNGAKVNGRNGNNWAGLWNERQDPDLNNLLQNLLAAGAGAIGGEIGRRAAQAGVNLIEAAKQDNGQDHNAQQMKQILAGKKR